MVSVDLVSISVQKCKANEKKLAARLLWTPSDCMQNLEPFSKCSRGTVIFIQNIEQILNVKLQHTSKSVAGIDIFTSKKYEDICPSTHNMNVPNVSRSDYQLNDIQSDGFLELMDDNNEIREDLKLPETDLGKEIRSKFDNGEGLLVTVLKAMGEEMVVGHKALQNK
ncbi:Eukaryotic translation initiation factor 5A [Stylophora pistillata]|uniref:Eukaryotic translation initiation factor 5A n=1 Tax=Stylophora pistillata TaxID=50429 RepID=A0A2B4S5U4_STYPI|nr:Eukaryotic translation initiation factor 5A [Stylophora pistillata]